ncbi:ribonuclease H-like domain-containing protein, partial [Tanacetum coccineum]
MCDKKNKVLFTDTECLVLSPDFKLPDENQVLLKVPRQHNMYSFNLENFIPFEGLTCLIAKATTDESNKWHRSLGHVNFKNLNKLVKGNLVREFKNRDMIEFCGSKGIKREYSKARTPQQNGVAERKNRQIHFYLTLFGLKQLVLLAMSLIGYIRPFGYHVTILNTIDHLGKFQEKADEGFLVGYSLSSKAFRVYNLETKRVEENLHVKFLKNKSNVAGKGPTWLFDLDYLTDSMNYQPVTAENRANKPAGLVEDNNFAGIKDSAVARTDALNDDSNQENCVLPIWSSYTSTIKSLEVKSSDNDSDEDVVLKRNEE